MVARLAEEVMTLDTEIGDTDAMIEERFRQHRHAEIILSMPGFGVIPRAEFLKAATGGDIAAFGNTDRLAAVADFRPPRVTPAASAATSNAPAATTDGCCAPVTWHSTSPSAPTPHRGSTTTANAPKGKRHTQAGWHLPAAASTSCGRCCATTSPINPPHLTPQRLDNFIENLFRDE